MMYRRYAWYDSRCEGTVDGVWRILIPRIGYVPSFHNTSFGVACERDVVELVEGKKVERELVWSGLVSDDMYIPISLSY